MKINSAVNIEQIENDYHITINLVDICQHDLLISYINDLKEFIVKHDIFIIYQKIYRNCNPEIAKIIEENLQWDQQINAPITFALSYDSPYETSAIGVHLYGKNKSEIINIKTSKSNDCAYIQYDSGGMNYLYGYHIFDRPEEGFNQLNLKLIEHNYKASDIVRTWFYLNNILTEYQSFNQARNHFFALNKISYKVDSKDLPASTCIGGKTCYGKSVIMIAAAHCDNKLLTKQRVYNNMQNEAEGNNYLYQPSFSRAMMLLGYNRKELQISGTASIGTDGQTKFLNNPYKQIELTLRNIINILDEVGMQMCDIVESNVYIKSKQYYSIFIDICKQLKISFPYVCVISDVCRDDLLFEIDGIAKIKKG